MFNKTRQNIKNKVASTHRDNLKQNLRHRLEVARAKGDENLVRQLEAEAAYLKI